MEYLKISMNRFQACWIYSTLGALLCLGISACDTQTQVSREPNTANVQRAVHVERMQDVRAPGAITSAERRQIDRLKQTVDEQPTTDANFRDRARLVWRWLNAVSMMGAETNPDADAVLWILMHPDTKDGAGAVWYGGGRRIESEPHPTVTKEAAYSYVDMIIRELRLKEDAAEAIGLLEADTDTPLVAHELATVSQTYTVGARALTEGATIGIDKHWLSYYYPMENHWQAGDPAADNYVTIRSTSESAVFEPVMVDSWRYNAYMDQGLGFRLVKGHVAPGERVTVTYGDKSGGGRGFRVQYFSNELMPFT